MTRTLTASERALLIALLLAVGISSRFLPHLPGATALTAVLFASAVYLGPRTTLVLSLVMLIATDLLIGSYELPVMISVYGSFLLIAVLGMLFARTSSRFRKAALLVSSSVLFYLITNTAVWYFTPWYAKDAAGLVLSLTLGLPFLKFMLVTDIVYTAGLLYAIRVALNPARSSVTQAYAA